jgi:hypothetical protein
MKKLLFISVLLFMGCGYTTSSVLTPPKIPIPEKMKSLNVGIEGLEINRFTPNAINYQAHTNTVFIRNVEQNLCESSESKWGYIDYQITFENYKTRWYSYPTTFFYTLLSGCYEWMFFLIKEGKFIVFSFNTFWHDHELEAEISIYNSEKKIIKKYIINTTTTLKSGFITLKENSPNRLNARYHSDIQAMNSIMYKLSDLLLKDVSYLNSKLESAGVIK